MSNNDVGSSGMNIEEMIAAVLLIAIIPAIICGIVTALVASRNERSGFLGFVTGFFFGPFGVMTYMIMGESMELRLRMQKNAQEEGAFED